MLCRKGLLLAVLLLASCKSGGNAPPLPSDSGPTLTGWTQLYGSGASGASFTFPASPGSVQYVVEPPPKVQLGQTITMVFNIGGSGTWGITDKTDGPPPTIHLLLWEKGDDGTGQGVYETYREWCGRTVITMPGQYTVSCVVSPSNFTGVFGKTPSAAAFQQLLNNLYAVGFTFGGSSFAGHGLYSASGALAFQLISYSVQ